MKKPIIHLVVAVARNRVIGKDGKLPWHLREDLLHFKKLTTEKTVVMGRKTLLSIGKPLPNRKNWVLSRDVSFHFEGVEIFNTIALLLERAKADNLEELFIIGGGEIYALFIAHATFLHITEVETDLEGDTFFPIWQREKWEIMEESFFEKNADNQYNFKITELRKRFF